eukprot:scaffold87525_cov58-Phaeocystis_antarctica.AAC.4
MTELPRCASGLRSHWRVSDCALADARSSKGGHVSQTGASSSGRSGFFSTPTPKNDGALARAFRARRSSCELPVRPSATMKTAGRFAKSAQSSGMSGVEPCGAGATSSRFLSANATDFPAFPRVATELLPTRRLRPGRL